MRRHDPYGDGDDPSRRRPRLIAAALSPRGQTIIGTALAVLGLIDIAAYWLTDTETGIWIGSGCALLGAIILIEVEIMKNGDSAAAMVLNGFHPTTGEKLDEGKLEVDIEMAKALWAEIKTWRPTLNLRNAALAGALGSIAAKLAGW